VASTPVSIPGVVDVHVFRGASAHGDAPLDLVIEIPHGATTTADFTSLAARLTSPLPDGLADFFHVNTDTGAPELGVAIAARLVADHPTRSAAVLRCRIPRTFIDCNRRIDAAPADFKAGKVTPGLMPWITTDADRELLRAAYDGYSATVRAGLAALATDGAVLMLHTYAPRTVDVEVDHDIGPKLRRAYQPEVEPTWPLRPEIDVISKTVEGVDHAPAAVVDALRSSLAATGIALATGETYPLHPSTLAWDYVQARPGRALCVEVRRDLLADPFEPFVQMTIGSAKVDRLVGPFTSALGRWW
jgi:N-formylglutamate amidohydrolase